MLINGRLGVSDEFDKKHTNSPYLLPGFAV
jgi:hypothetical protein